MGFVFGDPKTQAFFAAANRPLTQYSNVSNSVSSSSSTANKTSTNTGSVSSNTSGASKTSNTIATSTGGSSSSGSSSGGTKVGIRDITDELGISNQLSYQNGKVYLGGYEVPYGTIENGRAYITNSQDLSTFSNIINKVTGGPSNSGGGSSNSYVGGTSGGTNVKTGTGASGITSNYSGTITAGIKGYDQAATMINGKGYINGMPITEVLPGVKWVSTPNIKHPGGAYGYYVWEGTNNTNLTQVQTEQENKNTQQNLIPDYIMQLLMQDNNFNQQDYFNQVKAMYDAQNAAMIAAAEMENAKTIDQLKKLYQQRRRDLINQGAESEEAIRNVMALQGLTGEPTAQAISDLKQTIGGETSELSSDELAAINSALADLESRKTQLQSTATANALSATLEKMNTEDQAKRERNYQIAQLLLSQLNAQREAEQYEKNYRLQEAQVTGYYNGQPTASYAETLAKLKENQQSTAYEKAWNKYLYAGYNSLTSEEKKLLGVSAPSLTEKNTLATIQNKLKTATSGSSNSSSGSGGKVGSLSTAQEKEIIASVKAEIARGKALEQAGKTRDFNFQSIINKLIANGIWNKLSASAQATIRNLVTTADKTTLYPKAKSSSGGLTISQISRS